MKKCNLRILLALLLFAIPLLSGAQDQYGPIRRGQDLWDVARQVTYQHYKDAGVSHTQVMLALLNANPGAFAAPCNANSPLRVGAVLTVPAPAQVQALDREQAQRQFDRQLQQWEEARLTGKPLACPAETESKPADVAAPAAPQPAVTPPTVTTVTSPPPAAALAGREPMATAPTPVTVRSIEKPATDDWLFERKHRVELEWIAVALFGLLLLTILLRQFRRKPSAAAIAAPAITPPSDDFAQLSVTNALGKLRSDGEHGLSAAEAAQRLQQYGPNALEEKKVTLWQQLVPFFWGPIPWMIEVAAVLSLLTQDWRAPSRSPAASSSG